ncbi:uncharacterized protein LOC142350253 isoform X1 [Convolutriloba macropyga]|uniref:uncharacterized protein LOC142350253 isoform X1 n=1 Tax=Convolutriloba macropyga TaxID=536237 RepID=UPI003F522B3F
MKNRLREILYLLLALFSCSILLQLLNQNETLNKFKATVSLLPRFGRNKINNPTTLENEHVNVSVLVYTFSRMFKDGLRDLMFEGNLREECNLQFDCTFKQKFNHQVTPKLFYSMDAVLVGVIS